MAGKEEEPQRPFQKNAGGLLIRRLGELATERGSEAVEQTRQEKATGTPLPQALVLFRRLGEIAADVAGRDAHTRRDFAIVAYACGWAILDELLRQDAELSVLVNRQKGRPDTAPLLVSAAQTEVARAVETQSQGLVEAFPTVDQLLLSPRQQQVVADVVGRVEIRQPHPMEAVWLDRPSLTWPGLVAQQEAEATLAAAGPDPAGHRRVVVNDEGEDT